MKRFLKTLPLAGLLLCASASWQPLAAQTSVVVPVFAGPPPPDSQTSLLPPAVILTAPPNRVYVGSLTRTASSGQVTTGDVILSVTPQGSVRANLTYNGHVHPYYGVVQRNPSTPQGSDRAAKRRAGVLAVTRVVNHPTTPGIIEFVSENLALTVTQSAAYGGTTGGKGTVTFTARRFGVVFSPNGSGGITLPVGTTPVSGGGVIGSTLPGG